MYQMLPNPHQIDTLLFSQELDILLILFPTQSRNDEEDGEGDGASYQLDMMRCLREVNVDNNTVGW